MKQLLIAVGVLALAGCSSVSPDAGHEAVLVMKPVFAGHGGVDGTTIKPGLSYVAWTTDAIDVNMQPQRVDMEFDDLMTSSGVPIDFHAVFTYQVTDAVRLVRDFGGDWVDRQGPGFFVRNLDQPFRTAVRDAVKRREMNEMAITATAAEAVDDEVTAHMERLITEYKVPIRLIDLSLGRANPPDAIKDQRIKTAEQEQRIETEKQTKLAEDQRENAERSRATADNAYRVAMQLDPDQFLRLESIKAMREVCGGGKCSIISTGALPTFGIK